MSQPDKTVLLLIALACALAPPPGRAQSAKPEYVDTTPDPAATLHFTSHQKFVVPAVDPDEGLNLSAAWDKWRKRVDDEMHERFAKKIEPIFQNGPRLVTKVSYVVAQDGRIGNVRIIERSADRRYDLLVAELIDRAGCDAFLKFPPTSKRKFVENTGTFSNPGWTANETRLLPGGFPAEAAPVIGPSSLAK